PKYLRKSAVCGQRIAFPGKPIQQALMSLEILHLALVLFSSCTRLEGSEIAPPARLWVHLAGIEPVFAGFQLADHGWSSHRRVGQWRRKHHVPESGSIRNESGTRS